MAIGVIVGVLIGGLVLVGGGITAAVVLLADDDDSEPQWSSTGNVTVQTDIQSGEFLVDGSSRGTVVPGQVFRIERGAHTFNIREAGSVTASGTLTVTAGQEHTLTLNRTSQPVPLPINPLGNDVMIPGQVQNLTGELRPTDPQLPSGKYYDSYTFQWAAGSRIRIEMNSTDLDTYLTLRYPSGREETNDDREPGNFNAMIDTTVTETGTYQLTATTFSSNQTGDYTLIVHSP